MAVRFVPPRVPLVDLRTGTITREWYLLLQTLFTSDAADNTDELLQLAPANGGNDVIAAALERLGDALSVAPVAVQPLAANDDLTPAVVPVFFSADDVMPLVNALHDRIAMLEGRINDLSQGPGL